MFETQDPEAGRIHERGLARRPAPGGVERCSARALGIAISAVLLGCGTGRTAKRAGDAATSFYATKLRLHVDGLPTEAQQSTLSPLISTRLDSLLRAARDYQTRYEREHPGDKPPFVEGDLFSSLFEGPARFEITGIARDGAGFRVHVRFEADTGGPPPFRWTDDAIVKQEGARMVLDDVELGGGWAFATKGKLSEILKSRGG